MASNVIKWFNIVTCRGRVGLSYIGDIILLIFVLKKLMVEVFLAVKYTYRNNKGLSMQCLAY